MSDDRAGPEVRREFVYTVTADLPAGPTAGAPTGAQQYWRLSGARIEGERLRAGSIGAGIDWMGVGDDGFWRPDCRLQLLTDDGEVVLMSYHGLVEQTPAFTRAAEADEPTSWQDQYLRIAVTFRTGSPRYAWLTTALFVGAGRLLGTGRIEYAVYRVT